MNHFNLPSHEFPHHSHNQFPASIRQGVSKEGREYTDIESQSYPESARLWRKRSSCAVVVDISARTLQKGFDVMGSFRRPLWFFLGLSSFCIGVVGIFLPLLPTTPLMLLAVYFFSRSSEKFHRWIMCHPQFGPPLHDWYENRVIRPRAKIMASVMILVGVSFPLFVIEIHAVLRVLAVVVMGALLFFILTRKSG